VIRGVEDLRLHRHGPDGAAERELTVVGEHEMEQLPFVVVGERRLELPEPTVQLQGAEHHVADQEPLVHHLEHPVPTVRLQLPDVVEEHAGQDEVGVRLAGLRDGARDGSHLHGVLQQAAQGGVVVARGAGTPLVGPAEVGVLVEGVHRALPRPFAHLAAPLVERRPVLLDAPGDGGEQSREVGDAAGHGVDRGDLELTVAPVLGDLAADPDDGAAREALDPMQLGGPERGAPEPAGGVRQGEDDEAAAVTLAAGLDLPDEEGVLDAGTHSEGGEIDRCGGHARNMAGRV
jgi:hypothetical protein